MKWGDPRNFPWTMAFLPSQITNAQLLIQVLKQCGDELTRENVMKQAANLKNFGLPMLLPGVRINTSATDYEPIKQLQLMRFDGKECVRFGEVIGP